MKKPGRLIAVSAAIAAVGLLSAPAKARSDVDKQIGGTVFVPVQVSGAGVDGTITEDDVNGAPIVGDTTGGVNSIPSIPLACNTDNWTLTAGVERVYQFTPGSGANLTFVLTSLDTAAYDPFVYILATLGDSSSCVIGSDDTPSVNAPSITYAAFTPDQPYYVYADSYWSSDAGPFSLAVTGTLPVSLQEFSID